MLRSNKTCYWKASRAIPKNNFNCTHVVDGVGGGSKIANVFKDKYERLFNSVKMSTTYWQPTWKQKVIV